MTCPDCGKWSRIDGKCCPDCQKAYRKTDKYKAYQKAYRKTDKYKAYQKAYYLKMKAKKKEGDA